MFSFSANLQPVTCSDYWQSFLDEHLLSSGHLRSAVIMGNNGMVLGRSKDLDLKKWELSNLVDNIHIPAKMADQGIAFLGNKYTFLGKNDNVVRAAVRNERQMVRDFATVDAIKIKVCNRRK